MWEPLRYFGSVFGRAFRNGHKKGFDRLTTLAVALVAALVGAYEGGVVTFQWQNFHWKPAVYSSAAFFIVFGIFHYLRAQWEIYRDVKRELKGVSEENVRLASAVARLTPQLVCLGGGPTMQAKFALVHAIMIGNQNAMTYNHANGVHGTLEFIHGSFNPTTVEIGWCAESNAEPPERSVNIEGGRNRRFIWIMQIENTYYIPQVNGNHFARGQELAEGAYTIIVRLEGTNCSPLERSCKINIGKASGMSVLKGFV
jgi:hypothetical protein